MESSACPIGAGEYRVQLCSDGFLYAVQLQNGIRLPVTLDTCELIDDRWQRWLAWDPVRMVDAHADALRSLRGLYVDCGRRDQYGLIHGARRLHHALDRLGVAHRYDEFDDDHTAIDYRMDESLPFLARALTR